MTRGQVRLHAKRAVLYAAVFVAAAGVTLWIVGLVVAADAGQRAADRASQQAQAQARITTDQRQAMTRRVDLLTAQIDATRDQLEAQARTAGRQEQAIRDLAAQVRAMGGRPVSTGVATGSAARGSSGGGSSPRPGVTARPTPRSTGSSPSPSSRPSTTRPSPRPSPSPSEPGGLLDPVCSLLPLC